MAITYTLPNGTVITTLAQVADFVFQTRQGLSATPTNGEVVVMGDRKPGTAAS
jgi:hypothetical protein